MQIKYLIEHLNLVLVSSFFTTIFGLMLGILAYKFSKSKKIILYFVDILQTIPVLALLGFIMLITGATFTTVVIGIVLYSLLPIVRNTILGFEMIDKPIIDVAKAMGMTPVQRLFKIELVLAFPTIFSGIKIAIVTSIGIAVFGAVVGGGGLGTTINRAIMIQDYGVLAQATFSLMLMAVVFDFVMGVIEKKILNRRRL